MQPCSEGPEAISSSSTGVYEIQARYLDAEAPPQERDVVSETQERDVVSEWISHLQGHPAATEPKSHRILVVTREADSLARTWLPSGKHSALVLSLGRLR